MGRSGTRNFADVLSRHEAVSLQGEIPHSSMAKLFDLLDDLDSKHAYSSDRMSRWLNKKANYIEESFGYMSQGNVVSNGGAYYFGHKTPRSERFFTRYEKHFLSASVEAHYLYCCRDPLSVWASYKNMSWNEFDTVEKFCNEYSRSFKIYHNILKTAPGRVHILNLNDFISSSDKKCFIRNFILSKLDLGESDDYWRNISTIENTNSSKEKMGTFPKELSSYDVDYIVSESSMNKIISKYFPSILGSGIDT